MKLRAITSLHLHVLKLAAPAVHPCQHRTGSPPNCALACLASVCFSPSCTLHSTLHLAECTLLFITFGEWGLRTFQRPWETRAPSRTWDHWVGCSDYLRAPSKCTAVSAQADLIREVYHSDMALWVAQNIASSHNNDLSFSAGFYGCYYEMLSWSLLLQPHFASSYLRGECNECRKTSNGIIQQTLVFGLVKA